MERVVAEGRKGRKGGRGRSERACSAVRFLPLPDAAFIGHLPLPGFAVAGFWQPPGWVQRGDLFAFLSQDQFHFIDAQAGVAGDLAACKPLVPAVEDKLAQKLRGSADALCLFQQAAQVTGAFL